jgi:hypothetical protein
MHLETFRDSTDYIGDCAKFRTLLKMDPLNLDIHDGVINVKVCHELTA